MRSRSVLLSIAKIFSLFIIVIALSASPASFAVEQPSDIPAWLRALCRRRRRSNRTSGVAEGARALLAKSARRRGQKSLLLRHGRYPSPAI